MTCPYKARRSDPCSDHRTSGPFPGQCVLCRVRILPLLSLVQKERSLNRSSLRCQSQNHAAFSLETPYPALAARDDRIAQAMIGDAANNGKAGAAAERGSRMRMEKMSHSTPRGRRPPEDLRAQRHGPNSGRQIDLAPLLHVRRAGLRRDPHHRPARRRGRHAHRRGHEGDGRGDRQGAAPNGSSPASAMAACWNRPRRSISAMPAPARGSPWASSAPMT